MTTDEKGNPMTYWGGLKEAKQETLEEAAKRIYGSDALKDVEYYAFLNGAKWQMERSYSEEEVEELIYNVCGAVARLQGIILNGSHINTAYKQHKKK